jgi:hypothetical protein
MIRAGMIRTDQKIPGTLFKGEVHLDDWGEAPPWHPFQGGSSFGRLGRGPPLAPFSRGKFVWTTGEELLLVKTMLKARSYVDEP